MPIHFLKVAFFAIMFWLLVPVALAQTPDTDPTETDTPIATDNSGPSDKAIQNRISEIYAELSGLEDVTVTVNEGIVTLGGEVPSDAKAQSAMRLATRSVGVVAVEDEIERTLSVEDNLAPVLQSYRDRFRSFVKALPLISLALLTLIFFTLLGQVIGRRDKLWRKITRSPFLASILSQAFKILLFIIGAVLALDILGASTLMTTLLGGAGVIGIAIGFAVRDTIENYIASVMLSLRQPFRARDYVKINEHEGIVVRLTSRATILMTLDGNHLRIPNATVFKGTILNYTTNPERRFSFQLGIGANDDPMTAMTVGLDAIRAHDFVLEEPAPGASIVDVGDSNILIKYSGWIDQTDTSFGKARSLSIRSVMSALSDAGLSMPEPTYRLQVNPDTAGVLSSSNKPKSTGGKSRVSTAGDDEIIDVTPDTDLQDKVEEEILASEGGGLLDEDTPTE